MAWGKRMAVVMLCAGCGTVSGAGESAEQTRIQVFADRVKSVAGTDLEGCVLEYVLAHELGHVLLRTATHTATGVMKAQWEPGDYSRMATQILTFSSSHAAAIRSSVGSTIYGVNPAPQDSR